MVANHSLILKVHLYPPSAPRPEVLIYQALTGFQIHVRVVIGLHCKHPAEFFYDWFCQGFQGKCYIFLLVASIFVLKAFLSSSEWEK